MKVDEHMGGQLRWQDEYDRAVYTVEVEGRFYSVRLWVIGGGDLPEDELRFEFHSPVWATIYTNAKDAERAMAEVAPLEDWTCSLY